MGMPVWCIGCGDSPANGASRRSCGRRYWRAMRSGIQTLGRRWRRVFGEGKALVDHETLRRWPGGEPTDRAPAAPTSPAMAGAQAVFWGDGATGWFASRLVRRAARQVRADGHGGRCDQPDLGAIFRGRNDASQLRRVGRLDQQVWPAAKPGMWIGPASTGAKGWAASPNRSRARSRKPSLGGRCGS